MIRRIAVLMGFGVIALIGGCSKNVPCTTDPAQVDSARSALESSNGALSSAQSELKAAEAKKAELDENIRALEDTDALRERLDLLKKGSGR